MSSPVRLQKVEDVSITQKIETFLLRYAYILLPLCFIVLLILIALVIAVAIDISSANPMVESGNYYNHFKDVI